MYCKWKFARNELNRARARKIQCFVRQINVFCLYSQMKYETLNSLVQGIYNAHYGIYIAMIALWILTFAACEARSVTKYPSFAQILNEKKVRNVDMV